MDQVPIAPYPPSEIRLALGSEEWEVCLDTWLSMLQYRLRLPSKQTSASSGNASGFLVSYYHELVHHGQSDQSQNNPKSRSLHSLAFRLSAKNLLETKVPEGLLTWEFLCNFTRVHSKTSVLQRLYDRLWKLHAESLRNTFQQRKDALTRTMDSSNVESLLEPLTQLASLVRASPDTGAFFMAGSDFLDGLMATFDKSQGTPSLQKAVPVISHLCLLSLTRMEPPNTSLLTDQLYSLKTHTDRNPKSHSLLNELVTNSSLLTKLRRSTNGSGTERLLGLLNTLETYRSPSQAKKRRPSRRKSSKGKGKQRDEDGGELHMHRMSLVTQVQDLFSDLGAGFILKLLNEYNDDVEQATAHLLDESLPSHLASADRAESAPIYPSDRRTTIDHLAPRSTPPPPEPKQPDPYLPARRNIFDNDELDTLSHDTSRLHLGKRDRSTPSADTQPNKSAILSALAAFDSDDDERDDTYDVEDVGGTIDRTAPDGEPGPSGKLKQEENDMALFTVYKSSPELFGRTFNVRRGQPRAALKAQTGMTDEAIEGWFVMLNRDPRRLKRLEEKFGTFDGRQNELAGSAYREGANGSGTEDSDVPGSAGDRGRGGGFRGRGRGRGRGGAGGRGGGGSAVAGPSGDPATAQAQRRKEASKGSRANHNRRDQRARKMARGGFAG
ncbi:hypothetical protein MBLNU230_g1364t1 [Neophaeotheca triangularis]